MKAAIRSVLAVVLGLVVAFVLIMTIEFVNHFLYRIDLPPGTDPSDMAAIKAALEKSPMPLGALLMVLLAYVVGTFVGAFLAAALAGRSPLVHGLIVGGLFLAVGILNLLMLPHPAWFWVACIVVFPSMAYLGAKCAVRIRSSDRQDAGSATIIS